jgi:ABC-type bacteriocin/lantibiotic exporter with double-glycine peptidase domain
MAVFRIKSNKGVQTGAFSLSMLRVLVRLLMFIGACAFIVAVNIPLLWISLASTVIVMVADKVNKS